MKIKDKKILPIGIGLLMLVAVALSLSGIYSVFTPSVSASPSYHSVVCIYKNGKLVQPCTHNTLINGGKDLIAAALNGTGTESVKRIAVGNCTTATATDTQLCGGATNEETLGTAGASACGFANATGTWIVQNSQAGSWNVTKTFTSSCTGVYLNATGLYNDSLSNGLANTLFAETTFTGTTLNTNDALNVTWGIYIS